MNSEPKTVGELAGLVGGKVIGDESVAVSRVASIDEAGPGDITFLGHPRYRSYLAGCKASAIIVGPGAEISARGSPGRSFLQVPQPYVALATIIHVFNAQPRYDGKVSPLAVVDLTAQLEEQVTVYPHVYVGKGVHVGRGTVLFPGVFLGDGVEVGENCILYPQVTVRDRCRVGNRVILHPGAVIGSDGFGYAGEGKNRVKIPQVGIVVIEDDVEIGANATVDRATLGRTVIGRGTKIDNLVQIAHNVVVGEHSLIVAQTGIAGSTRLGREVILGGQVGVKDHVEIGDRAIIGPQSGIHQSVPPGALLSGGSVASPHRLWLKVTNILPRLPQLWTSVRKLERTVAQLTRKGGKGVRSHARR